MCIYTYIYIYIMYIQVLRSTGLRGGQNGMFAFIICLWVCSCPLKELVCVTWVHISCCVYNHTGRQIVDLELCLDSTVL